MKLSPMLPDDNEDSTFWIFMGTLFWVIFIIVAFTVTLGVASAHY